MAVRCAAPGKDIGKRQQRGWGDHAATKCDVHQLGARRASVLVLLPLAGVRGALLLRLVLPLLQRVAWRL